jgi:hypothetical protein
VKNYGDQQYFRGRAKQKAAMAERATGVGISSIHRTMAREYLKLADAPDVSIGKRLFLLGHEPLGER